MKPTIIYTGALSGAWVEKQVFTGNLPEILQVGNYKRKTGDKCEPFIEFFVLLSKKIAFHYKTPNAITTIRWFL